MQKAGFSRFYSELNGMNWYSRLVVAKNILEIPPALLSAMEKSLSPLADSVIDHMTTAKNPDSLAKERPIFRLDWDDAAGRHYVNIWGKRDEGNWGGKWIARQDQQNPSILGAVMLNFKFLPTQKNSLVVQLRNILTHELVHAVDPRLDTSKNIQYRDKNNPAAYDGSQEAYRNVEHEIEAYTSTFVLELRRMLTKWATQDDMQHAAFSYIDLVMNWLRSPASEAPAVEHIEVFNSWRKNPAIWRRFASRVATAMTQLRSTLQAQPKRSSYKVVHRTTSSPMKQAPC